MIGDTIAEKGYLKTQIEKWEKISDELSSTVSRVNDETKVIKYNDVPSNIYLKVESIVEELKLSDEQKKELESNLEYQVRQVREAVNNLESEIYKLVEPFEELQRDAENKKDDFEYELDDLEWELEKAS
tara:strand:+ start:3192 stop:3578 length:387 start_codon:yes stop_codon:yes gene_type:complete